MAGRWEDLCARLGRALAALVPEAAAERLRSHYAAAYGKCRRCDAPLGGPSPSQLCEPCHVDELLERAGDGKPPADA